MAYLEPPYARASGSAAGPLDRPRIPPRSCPGIIAATAAACKTRLAGAAAVLSTAGFLSRFEDAEAALVPVVITNLLNNPSVDIAIKNNNVAVRVCAVTVPD